MIRFVTRSSFLVGVVIGVILAVLLKFNIRTDKPVEHSRLFSTFQYRDWFKGKKLIHKRISFEDSRYSNKSYFPESKYLYNEVTVLCVMLVKSQKNAKAAQNTWAQHCNKFQLLNVTSEKRKIPVIKKSSGDSSWTILCKMFKDVPEEYKWILVVYDYTFVVVENLRLFVASFNPDDKYYLGHVVKFWGTDYNMGQAGYVLSRGTVNVLKKKFHEKGSCSKSMTYRNQEDYYLGKTLVQVNITPVDTRDVSGLSTFHPYNLYHVFFPGQNYYKFSVYPHECCSPFTIAFQSVEGDKMYTYYYLIYTLQLFHYGISGNKPALKSLTDDEIWKKFLKERNVSTNITPEQYYKIWENIVDDPTSFAKHMKREEYFDYL